MLFTYGLAADLFALRQRSAIQRSSEGIAIGFRSRGAAGHFPEAARRHRELRMVGLSSFRPQLSRSRYSFTTSICLSITSPVNRSIATFTQ